MYLGLEKRDRNIQYLKQEQEQPSHVSVLERIRLEEETKDSVHRFVKKVLEASRLNWTNIMARCNEETSLLNEFSHGDHNKGADSIGEGEERTQCIGERGLEFMTLKSFMLLVFSILYHDCKQQSYFESNLTMTADTKHAMWFTWLAISDPVCSQVLTLSLSSQEKQPLCSSTIIGFDEDIIHQCFKCHILTKL
ncbi:hypothetical protein HID58_051077 [Brassica napus]|uniref:Uncharacterized protein n=1 Tax=Brassica napus TaxID=3708 RepID=A0ABQ8A802_BRANA|nr:hypothetical protein HID58_051077 [Brassica napus]